MFDIRKILNNYWGYSVFQKIIGKRSFRDYFFKNYIGDVSGLNILDLGCGPCNILKHIHSENLYVGIDYNSNYIESAKRPWGGEGRQFLCIDLNSYSQQAAQKFDMVLMMGVMHHLNDEEVENCLKSIKRLLADNGRFISLDPCYTKGMNPIARLLCMLDRGKFVRYAEEFICIQQKFFADVNFEIRTDGLRLPYSRILFSNRNPK